MFITNQYSTVDTRGIDTDTTAVPVDYSVPGIQIYNHRYFMNKYIILFNINIVIQ